MTLHKTTPTRTADVTAGDTIPVTLNGAKLYVRVAAVRAERALRAAWLRSVTCTNPPPAVLLTAEDNTGRALAALTRLKG